MGFLLVCVPVQVKENSLGQIEFGPLGIEQIDRVEFEHGLSRLGFPAAMRSLLHSSLGEMRTVRAEDIEGVLILLQRVAAVIADELSRASSSATAQEPAAVTMGRRFAELHIGDKITLGDVSRHAALSPDHFSRLFRRTTGLSFGEYVNRCRMENAQRLLLDSSQRVAEISYACGFDSVPHFNRVFRRVTGVSPTGFRRQSRGLQANGGEKHPAA
jgi:AraC-like DNA-binding protein